MKAEELQGKTVDELEKALIDLKKEQFNLRFQKTQGQLENTAKIRVVRRNIARVKTFIGLQKAGIAVKAKAPKKAVEKKAKTETTEAKAEKPAAKKVASKKKSGGKAA